MADNKMQSMQNLNTKQKTTIVVFIIVIVVIIWQAWGLIGGGGAATPTPEPAATMAAERPGTSSSTTAMQSPSLPSASSGGQQQTPSSFSSRESELIRLQQETQEKYLAAINELQMLKISREIAETTQGIASAKLATVTAEKGVLDLFTKAPPPAVPVSSYASSLVSSGGLGTATAMGAETTTTTEGSSYIVLSVSYLVGKWNAIMGYQGKLYNVAVGDVLPPDGSTVVAISKAGVILRKDGAKKKVSLVSAI
ncbi:MAG: hypothetical protein A3E83_02320 [Gammaproteobacteria bacterium RIFCSPHIGHO2_12_FULL_41_20]|nr:MAG: hypothetical protein A3E83_02320 [Gammaproteobacteria bacterium RIFCSPHIGHO2_12_FULL_41_20]